MASYRSRVELLGLEEVGKTRWVETGQVGWLCQVLVEAEGSWIVCHEYQ